MTQAFNTTTSMGRLTLNVLLSFAQFEREVTGERIRDKIAASKRKGMWMGGLPPLGYDVQDRKLVVNESEAETVRHIFRALRSSCARSARCSRNWPRRHRQQGRLEPMIVRKAAPRRQAARARCALPDAAEPDLSRRDRPQGRAYPGEHAAIVDAELWDEVQRILADNRVNREAEPMRQSQASLPASSSMPKENASHRATRTNVARAIATTSRGR